MTAAFREEIELLATPTLIYCGGGNPRFYEISKAAGFEYGARLPDTVYGPLHFADQNYHTPNREKYMAALAKHKPVIASVLDLESEDQLPEVLSWAEEAAQYVQRIMLIPKVFSIIPQLPTRINNTEVILGYSVPTKYGGTEVPIWEFTGWPVHLLGGSPHMQIKLAGYTLDYSGGRGKFSRYELPSVTVFDTGQVISIDGNMTNLMATQHCQFWTPGTACNANNRFWPTLREANDGVTWGDGSATADAPYEAFKRSCKNIMETWQKLCPA